MLLAENLAAANMQLKHHVTGMLVKAAYME